MIVYAVGSEPAVMNTNISPKSSFLDIGVPSSFLLCEMSWDMVFFPDELPLKRMSSASFWASFFFFQLLASMGVTLYGMVDLSLPQSDIHSHAYPSQRARYRDSASETS